MWFVLTQRRDLNARRGEGREESGEGGGGVQTGSGLSVTCRPVSLFQPHGDVPTSDALSRSDAGNRFNAD